MKILSIALCLLMALPVFAGPRKRHAKQKARIHQGVKSGELTRGERKRLKHGQKRVRKAARRANADGTVTAEEAQRLNNMQDRQSKRIHRMKHNDRQRGGQGEAADTASE